MTNGFVVNFIILFLLSFAAQRPYHPRLNVDLLSVEKYSENRKHQPVALYSVPEAVGTMVNGVPVTWMEGSAVVVALTLMDLCHDDQLIYECIQECGSRQRNLGPIPIVKEYHSFPSFA